MNRVQQYVATPNTTGNVEFRNIRFVRPITPTISRRFYKGWLLNEVFDYLSVGGFSTSVTSTQNLVNMVNGMQIIKQPVVVVLQIQDGIGHSVCK